MRLPATVKPADAAGSQGVTVLTRLQDAKTAWRHAYEARGMYAGSAGRTVLLQQYIPGREYRAEPFTQHGRITHLAITTKSTTRGTHRVELAHTLPTPLPPALEQTIHQESAKAVRAVGIRNGASHTEVIVTRTGRPYVIETAPASAPATSATSSTTPSASSPGRPPSISPSAPPAATTPPSASSPALPSAAAPPSPACPEPARTPPSSGSAPAPATRSDSPAPMPTDRQLHRCQPRRPHHPGPGCPTARRHRHSRRTSSRRAPQDGGLTFKGFQDLFHFGVSLPRRLAGTGPSPVGRLSRSRSRPNLRYTAPTRR
ncbi:ATP-grasp domain-containing protein [Streptomyces sp. IMTB 1903]|uniref:ATP-grasp domain-containing protein n=1 Tax=Streptomyces sp. IMTB 1903 TaxID=1776680 RepID=UPI003B6396D8